MLDEIQRCVLMCESQFCFLESFFSKPDGNFKINQKRKAFCSLKNDKFIILNIDRNSANFFKREFFNDFTFYIQFHLLGYIF